MPKKQQAKHGGVVLEVLVAALLVGGALFYFVSNLVTAFRAQTVQNKKILATAFVSEGLEFFRSFRDDQLRSYIITNPISAALASYPLCAHINILDRDSGNIINRDPLVDLPRGNGLEVEANGPANRYYQIHVVNLAQNTAAAVGTAANDSISFRNDLCGQRLEDILIFGQLPAAVPPQVQLTDEERFMVTVGISYFGGPRGDLLQKLSLSTVLPDDNS